MNTATKPKRREFLQLAKTYKPDKPPKKGYNLAGWYVSEKLDGTRCFWDGGITRGMHTEDVPWAGVIDPKTGGRKKKIKPISTGLWSRYGNPIIAPDWFLNGLPAMFLDGELWAGRGNFQLCRSICGGDSPDDRFDQIQFAVYSSPAPESIFTDGEIKSPQFHCKISESTIVPWVNMQIDKFDTDFARVKAGSTFDEELVLIKDALEAQTDFAHLHQQIRLPENPHEAEATIERRLETTLDLGGEGLIIRNPGGLWTPKRVQELLKYKPFDDDEAIVTGFTSGRIGVDETLRGKIGAVITDYNGKRLEISGFRMNEREFLNQIQSKYAWEFPGEDMPYDFSGKTFKVGDKITFKYRELSDCGIPKEARYWRQAE
jgi:DNA ligase-1